MKNLLTFAISTIILLGALSAQEKQVHLFHGHNGFQDTWTGFKEDLQSKCSSDQKIHSYDYGFESTQGLTPYTTALKGGLESTLADSDDIVIGHSFGGAAARKFDEDDTQHFGAFITVGTPNKGAQFANSANNQSDPTQPSVKYYFQEGCEELVQGPIGAIENLDNAYFRFLHIFFESSLNEAFCECIFEYLVYQTEVGAFLGGTVDDLELDSAVSKIGEPKLPAVAIQATLNSPVHWNLIGDMMEDPRMQENVNLLPGVIECSNSALNPDAISDFSGIQMAATYSTLMNNLALYLESNDPTLGEQMNTFRKRLGVASRFFAKLAWFPGSLSPHFRKASEEFGEAARWIANSEGGYHNLIGAGGVRTAVTQTSLQRVYVCDCHCNGTDIPCDSLMLAEELGCDFMMPPPPDHCATNPADYCWETKPVTNTYYTTGDFRPNDGVVTLESQVLDGALRNVRVSNASMSHFQEPDHPMVWRQIFDQLDIWTAADPDFVLENCNF